MSNHDEFKKGDLVYVPKAGVGRISAIKPESPKSDQDDYTTVITAMDFIKNINPARALDFFTVVPSHFPLIEPVGQDVFEETIRLAYTAQDKRFENLDDLIEHAQKLINSEDIRDVGRAWSYLCGRSENEEIQKLVQQATKIFLNQKVYIDFTSKNQMLNKNRYDQVASALTRRILPDLTRPITPMIGEEIEPVEIPQNIDWSLHPVEKKNPVNRKKKQKKGGGKPPKKKKNNQPKKTDEQRQAEAQAAEEAVKKAEEEAARLAAEEAARQAEEQKAAQAAEEAARRAEQQKAAQAKVEEQRAAKAAADARAAEREAEKIARQEAEAEKRAAQAQAAEEKRKAEEEAQAAREKLAREAAEEAAQQQAAEQELETQQMQELEAYFNKIAQQCNDAEFNEVSYLCSIFDTEQANNLTFEECYLILHETFNEYADTDHDVVTKINKLSNNDDKALLGYKNYQGTVLTAFQKIDKIIDDIIDQKTELDPHDNAKNDPDACNRLIDRIVDRYEKLQM